MSVTTRTPSINWLAARAYWLALPPERRTFEAVATRFGVTRQRVGQIAERENWRKALAELEQEQERAEMAEVRKVVLRAARARGERLARTLEVFDRANDLTLELLPVREDGEIDLKKISDVTATELLGKMPGLFRMAELAAGEATDRVAISEVQPILVAFARIAIRRASPDDRADVLAELEQASAGLIAIQAAA